MRILVVEDEQDLNNVICNKLRASGYSVDSCLNGEDALDYIRVGSYDGVLMDIMLPKINGFEVVKMIRAEGDRTPVLFLTARDTVEDIVHGLDIGGNDYLIKPFSFEELLARIRAAVRHTRTPEGAAAVANSGVFTAGELTIDYDKHRVYIAGRDANLTQNEYKLVALLGLHAGKVLTYDYLIKELWGPSARSDNQILRVNMANIRRKIEKNPAQPAYIFTESGVGYRMVEGD